MVVTAESLPSDIQSWVTLCFQQILPVKCRLPLPNTHHSIGQGGGWGDYLNQSLNSQNYFTGSVFVN